MGNSLVYLAISIIVFFITFSLLFQFMPIILGAVYNAIDSVILTTNIDAEWLALYGELDQTQQSVIPLVMSLGLVLIVLKVLMAATNRGSD